MRTYAIGTSADAKVIYSRVLYEFYGMATSTDGKYLFILDGNTQSTRSAPDHPQTTGSTSRCIRRITAPPTVGSFDPGGTFFYAGPGVCYDSLMNQYDTVHRLGDMERNDCRDVCHSLLDCHGFKHSFVRQSDAF